MTHPLFHSLEVSPPSRLTLGSEFTSLPTLLDYTRVAPSITPENAFEITHVDQLIKPISYEDCAKIFKSLDFDHFLTRTLIDMARGVHVQEPLPSILAKVILLLTMYQHHGSYELDLHVETIIGLAASADVLHLEDLIEARPYASAQPMKPGPDGTNCPVCWESYVSVPAPSPLDVDDDGDLEMGDPADEVLMAKTRCGHLMCLDCLEAWIKQSPTCTVCRQPL